METERRQILKMLEAGQISTKEAFQLLEALNDGEPAAEPKVEAPPEPPPGHLPDMRRLWIYPTFAGAVVMAIGAPLMALGLTGRAALFWALFCGWIPFLIGLSILTLGVWSRNARWFHLRVKNARGEGRNFVFSLPLPLTLAAWVLRFARPYVPQLQKTAVDEAILALRDGLSDRDEDRPFYVNVQDGEQGEHVQIYIG